MKNKSYDIETFQQYDEFKKINNLAIPRQTLHKLDYLFMVGLCGF